MLALPLPLPPLLARPQAAVVCEPSLNTVERPQGLLQPYWL
jgi:hypothetical protein